MFGHRIDETSWIFPKCHFYRVSRVLKVKSLFSTYFWIEKSNPKNIFCIINLVNSQVNREEKIGIFMLSLSKKSIFNLFVPNFYVSYSNSICSLDMWPISSSFFFYIFSIVHFSKCWEHFFDLDLFSIDFLLKSWKLQKSHF